VVVLRYGVMSRDTDIGGPAADFPRTSWSAVLAARSEHHTDRERGFQTIISLYWKPVYKYIRLRWGKSNEEAKDLTQEFFTRVIEKGFLDSYDPSKARLRTFFRLCIDRFLANEAKAASRLKRGGPSGVQLDFESAERELELGPSAASGSFTDPASIDEFFEKEWLRSLFSSVLEQFRSECENAGKDVHFRIFASYDLMQDDVGGAARVSYRQLAEKYGVAVSDITNHLAWARREFRRITLLRIREMTTGEEEFRREARALLGTSVT
jgi:RNA polymerase sigma factor (sigma-70 family)